MILSENLLKDTLEEFHNKKKLSYVIEKSLPILFFGDLGSFIKQQRKVITVGLNPSNIEFQSNQYNSYSYFRFPEYRNNIGSLEISLSNYFKNDPYRKWFSTGYEPILNGMNCTFYNKKSKEKVLHTDICSPLSTNPTWSKLSITQQNELRKNGFNLWKRLVFEIKPNLIILSTRKSYLDSLNPRLKQVLYTVYKTKDGKPRRPFNLEHHQINILGLDIDLVYGEPKNLPFGSVSTEDKIKMGEIIEETFFKTSL